MCRSPTPARACGGRRGRRATRGSARPPRPARPVAARRDGLHGVARRAQVARQAGGVARHRAPQRERLERGAQRVHLLDVVGVSRRTVVPRYGRSRPGWRARAAAAPRAPAPGSRPSAARCPSRRAARRARARRRGSRAAARRRSAGAAGVCRRRRSQCGCRSISLVATGHSLTRSAGSLSSTVDCRQSTTPSIGTALRSVNHGPSLGPILIDGPPVPARHGRRPP
jgi:hypothetical protein